MLAIFVGGRSRRMGGYPKGMLRTAAGETLVEQHVRLAQSFDMEPVLVGAGADYRSLLPELTRLEDVIATQGPIGGLRSALAYAGTRSVFTVACDMPHLDRGTIAALREAGPATVTASRVLGSDKWNPFPARYQDAGALLEQGVERGVTSFQGFFSFANAVECKLPSASLVDADTPDEARLLHLRRAPYWSAASASSFTTAL